MQAVGTVICVSYW